MRAGGLYIHVPFCDGKCAYCAFYSVVYAKALADRFLAALGIELKRVRARFPDFRPETVYIGGGTPTVLNGRQLAALLSKVRGFCRGSPVVEWTIEANPGILTAGALRRLRVAGVTRISLGIQASDDAALAMLGRRHTWRDCRRAAALIRRSGISAWSADLIACVPGIAPAAWKRTIAKIVRMRPRHVSVYALTVEEGARLARAREFRPMGDAQQLRMLRIARCALTRAGYHRYEVSNYALPGDESRHNTGYWRDMDFIGCGPSASSRMGYRRWTNRPDVTAYCRALERGRDAPARTETVSPVTAATEEVVFGLRTRQGIDLGAIAARHHLYATAAHRRWRNRLAALKAGHLAHGAGDHWRLTERGLALADAVAVELMD